MESDPLMEDHVKERVIKVGICLIETKDTVRQLAEEFGVSKSTIHKDLVDRLPEVNPEMANQARTILDYHMSIRHLRGGEATRIKFLKLKRAH